MMKERELQAHLSPTKNDGGGNKNKVYPYLLFELKIKRPHQGGQGDITYLRL
ncbi:MAG: hypothetical protein H0X26_09855 [Alphaproteobacteria bacterium]|nr:hypothetical protein [Alphaproteobacteria bacterium]